ncbi:MAG: hypothetical protein AAB885_01580 [Patescibacteria group bacterium]
MRRLLYPFYGIWVIFSGIGIGIFASVKFTLFQAVSWTLFPWNRFRVATDRHNHPHRYCNFNNQVRECCFDLYAFLQASILTVAPLIALIIVLVSRGTPNIKFNDSVLEINSDGVLAGISVILLLTNALSVFYEIGRWYQNKKEKEKAERKGALSEAMAKSAPEKPKEFPKPEPQKPAVIEQFTVLSGKILATELITEKQASEFMTEISEAHKDGALSDSERDSLFRMIFRRAQPV